jgi:hypothetical protein
LRKSGAARTPCRRPRRGSGGRLAAAVTGAAWHCAAVPGAHRQGGGHRERALAPATLRVPGAPPPRRSGLVRGHVGRVGGRSATASGPPRRRAATPAGAAAHGREGGRDGERGDEMEWTGRGFEKPDILLRSKEDLGTNLAIQPEIQRWEVFLLTWTGWLWRNPFLFVYGRCRTPRCVGLDG